MNYLKISLSILITVVLSSCQQNNLQLADLVIKKGFIYTADSLNTIAEAVAIKDGKFIYVGDNKGVSSFIGDRTKVIDLEERMILPGFIDAHCHAISSFRYFFELNIYNLKTIEEVQNVINEYLISHPDAEYIKGRGWSDTDYPITGPDKKIIDEIVQGYPYEKRLWDLSEIKFDLSLNEIKLISEYGKSKFTKTNKLAIYATNDLAFGEMRQFEVYREEEGKVIPRVFRTKQDAISWLNS